MTRPPRLKAIQFNSAWMWINLVLVLGFDMVLLYYFGFKSVIYLVLSFFFSVGLHPLEEGDTEHYLVDSPQETYSYYTPNTLAFNVGDTS
ncbi:MAG: hypothetical protein R2766_06640 [Saprospiraceae bacterium]